MFQREHLKTEKKIPFEQKVANKINNERNKQLNQFSAIYFKKVELNTRVNEK